MSTTEAYRDNCRRAPPLPSGWRFAQPEDYALGRKILICAAVDPGWGRSVFVPGEQHADTWYYARAVRTDETHPGRSYPLHEDEGG